ncbi:MAG: trypsin-like peptidase domain-containing protein [Gemmatimonadaceae bacterium]|nr:trypsin-like peptidase domain-containing protein [Gemmatimonadaceae bacterium]
MATLTTRRSIAELIEMSPTLLDGLANSLNRRAYHRFHVPKKSGGSRVITAPTARLKEVQRRLYRVLSALTVPPTCAFGFIERRSTVHNAQSHTRSRWVLNIDLEEFFPSIHFGRVHGMLMAPPYHIPELGAQRIAALCCHESVLPQGAPTSPILANMIARGLDFALRDFANQNRCHYTRYADDLTFSQFRKRFPSALVTRGVDNVTRVSDELRQIVESHGFRLNAKKTRLAHYSERQEVTGLIVNSKRPNVPREFIRNLRAMLHAWERYGEEAAEATYRRTFAPRDASDHVGLFRETLLGRLSYLAMVKGRSDPVYVELIRRARERVDRKHGTNYFDTMPIPEDGVAVLMTTEGRDRAGEQGTGFVLRNIGVVTCYHVVRRAVTVEAFPWHAPLRATNLFMDRFNVDWDLAILRGNYGAKYQFEAGDDAQLRIGMPVRIVGFPNWAPDRPMSITETVIQGMNSDYFGARRFTVRDAIFGGNSGGPVLNGAGKVIGVAMTGMFQTGGGTENMITPISYVRRLAEQPAYDPFSNVASKTREHS